MSVRKSWDLVDISGIAGATTATSFAASGGSVAHHIRRAADFVLRIDAFMRWRSPAAALAHTAPAQPTSSAGPRHRCSAACVAGGAIDGTTMTPSCVVSPETEGHHSPAAATSYSP